MYLLQCILVSGQPVRLCEYTIRSWWSCHCKTFFRNCTVMVSLLRRLRKGLCTHELCISRGRQINSSFRMSGKQLATSLDIWTDFLKAYRHFKWQKLYHNESKVHMYAIFKYMHRYVNVAVRNAVPTATFHVSCMCTNISVHIYVYSTCKPV